MGAVASIYVQAGIILFANRKDWIISIAAPLAILVALTAFFHFSGIVSNIENLLSPVFYYELIAEMPLYH